ncbi:MAG: FAD-dependent oxidoreductase [Oscillospiraceae bacterium]|nr:FAD-dependent oxidoreductase [Oscillospiraceae bacterium]
MYDVVVIGAGPAGMTAAIYARRAARSVLVLEAVSCGGQILNTPDIENYPVQAHISGFDFSQKLRAQAEGLGAEFVFEKAVEVRDLGAVKEVITPKNSYRAGAVILATGSENRKLGLEDEDRLVGRGISYCATCDGNFYRNKVVAVVGGGNTALEDALYLADLAQKVYLIHRRDSFRGEETTAARLREKPNVEIIRNANVTRLISEKRLKAIEITDTLDGSLRTIELNGLFIAVGRIPENQNFAGLVRLDEAGYVLAGEDCHTGTAGIFAAGDNRSKLLRQLVTATADGAMAATEAVKYLRQTEQREV